MCEIALQERRKMIMSSRRLSSKADAKFIKLTDEKMRNKEKILL